MYKKWTIKFEKDDTSEYVYVVAKTFTRALSYASEKYSHEADEVVYVSSEEVDIAE